MSSAPWVLRVAASAERQLARLQPPFVARAPTEGRWYREMLEILKSPEMSGYYYTLPGWLRRTYVLGAD